MTTAIETPLIQDTPDGPGPLTLNDHGKAMIWDGPRQRFVVVEIPVSRGSVAIMRSGGSGSGGVSRLQDASDFGGTPGAATDGYAIIWDDGAGEFTLGAFEAAGAVAAHVAAGNPHTQYLLASAASAFGLTLLDDADAATARGTLGLGTAALLNVGTGANNIVQLNGSAQLPAVSGALLTNLPVAGSTTQVIFNNAGVYAGDAGLTYAAATDRLTVVGGIVAGDWSPPSDSTTAVSVWNAARSTRVVTVDTANIRVGVGITPTSIIDAQGAVAGTSGVLLKLKNTEPTGRASFVAFNDLNASASFSVLGSSYIVSPGAASFSASGSMAFFTNGTAATGGTGTMVFTVGGYDNNPTLKLFAGSPGSIAVGQSSATALLDIAASTTARASLRIRESGTRPTTPNSGDFWNNGAIASYQSNATTNAIVNSLILERASSGTPAVGLGLGIAARLESSTTEDQDAGRLTWEWVTATHASRASRGKLSAFYTSTEQNAMTWDGDTGGLKLGFYGVTAVARQVLATGAGASVDDVITALQALGLVRQSS